MHDEPRNTIENGSLEIGQTLEAKRGWRRRNFAAAAFAVASIFAARVSEFRAETGLEAI